MQDNPILGAVLFAIGAVLVALVYYSSNAQPEVFGSFGGGYSRQALLHLVVGYTLVLNGALLFLLGRRKLKRVNRH